MNINAILAVFKRNLGAYFGNPGGYVFICAFLLAGGMAAFWPKEFFDSNLANLDQLNKFLPHIMLGFIPAITMSIWADERRQGTDELLLTLPGSDLDVVIGKYLGALAIFTVSLVFSLVANTFALFYLGTPDIGLLVSTYVGYWFVGLAMLAVGMMASFLTANLTVAFILGVAFNTPLALLADWEWGIAVNFLDFSRGIISISGIAFFTGLALALLYVCSVLLGRRHWAGGPEGKTLSVHYLTRGGAAIVVALSIATVFRNNDFIRLDATEESLSTLSDGSLELLETLEGKGAKVEIDAFVSPADAMPESYVQTRINLLSALRELDRKSGDVSVTVHVIDAEDNASATAEKYGVLNQNGVNPPLFVQEQGRWMPWAKDLYLGLVFKGDYGQQTVPFLYKGLPVEYEIMRTLMTVGGATVKKRVGIFKTDAPMMGSAGMGMMGISMGGGSPAWEFVTELRKQYDVQEVTGGPIRKGDYDALVVGQPSTLEEGKIKELLAAIKAGVPTAIFEDPLPLINGSFTGTYEPRRNNQSPAGPGQPPPPAPSKGDISQLWSLLGVHFNVEPAARLQAIRKELNILKASANRTLAPLRGRFPVIGKFFAKLGELDRKASELDARVKANASLSQGDWDSLKLDELRETVRDLDYNHPIRRGVEEKLLSPPEQNLKGLEKRILRDSFNPFPKIPRTENFPDEFVYVGGGDGTLGATEVTSELQYLLFTCPGTLYDAGTSSLTFVILIADADVLADPFYNIRSRGPDSDFPLDVDNVTFSLNVVDQLTGESRFLHVRNRRRLHRTLEEFEKSIEEAREVASATIKSAEASIKDILEEENKKLNQALAEVQQNRQGQMTQAQFMQFLQTEAAKLQKNLAKRERELRKETDQKVKEAERSRDRDIKSKQNTIKRLSVFLPPIPLLLIAFAVFVRKKAGEIQGAKSSRVRK